MKKYRKSKAVAIFKRFYKKIKHGVCKKLKSDVKKINKKQKEKKVDNPPYTGKDSNSAKCAKKRAKKLGKLSTTADHAAMSKIYLECRQLNREAGGHFFDVDHILPFFAGGLHHEDNLQILSISEHRIKSDKDLLKYV